MVRINVACFFFILIIILAMRFFLGGAGMLSYVWLIVLLKKDKKNFSIIDP